MWIYHDEERLKDAAIAAHCICPPRGWVICDTYVEFNLGYDRLFDVGKMSILAFDCSFTLRLALDDVNEKIKHLDIIYSLLNRHIIYRTKIVKVLIRTDYQSEFTKSTRRSVPPHAGEVTTYAGPSGYVRVPAVNVKHAVDAVADVVVVVVPVDLVGVCGQRLHDV